MKTPAVIAQGVTEGNWSPVMVHMVFLSLNCKIMILVWCYLYMTSHRLVLS